MIKLKVWLTTPQGELLQAGECVSKDPDPQGRLQGQFRYNSEYLDHEDAFPLDPIHLPLSPLIFDADRPQAGVHGVFEDALPDEWGRRILARRYNLRRNEQRVPQLLLLLGSQGLGALSFSRGDIHGPVREDVDDRHLHELQRLAAKFEQDATSIEDEMALLFQAGSSPGGARPKAIVTDQKHSYLAKFASIRDQFDVVALEAATMEIAKGAGINTAASRLVDCGTKKVLLVKRFDINDSGGRNHLISMQTLLHADGYYSAGYQDLAQIIRQISSNPVRDLQQLFRQLVFNVLIGNTDDHLKNFCMLHDGSGWHLSPAFDLVPNIGVNREHVLRVGLYHVTPDRKTLLQEAKAFGVKRQQKAAKIIDEIFEVVSDWQNYFERVQVPAADISSIGKDIESRLRCVS